jgi:two-component system sensor histidine kinase YesM
VYTLIPEHVIEQKMHVVESINFVLIIVLVLSTVVLSVLLSNFITSPLIQLKRSFKRFQTGDFTVNAEVRGEDELADIVKGFNTMVANVNILIKEKYEIELFRRQSEIESLQSKINPHFLYNTLSSIKAVIQNENAETAREMVQDLSDLFRYSLNKGRFIVTLDEELDHANKYLSLQKLRFGDAFRIVFDVDADLLSSNILRLTVQPLVENAILHGLEDKPGERLIRIYAQSYANELWIYVEDNGKGMETIQVDEMNAMLSENPQTSLNSKTRDRVGIYNVNSRIKLYYGNEYGITLSSEPNEGTVVKVALPLDRGTQR